MTSFKISGYSIGALANLLREGGSKSIYEKKTREWVKIYKKFKTLRVNHKDPGLLEGGARREAPLYTYLVINTTFLYFSLFLSLVYDIPCDDKWKKLLFMTLLYTKVGEDL